MRITFATIDEFCDELAVVDPGNVFERTVRVRIDRMAEQDEAITFAVGLWATALVRTDAGDWVMEFGEIAGRDTRNNDNAGSAAAAAWVGQIRSAAEAVGLKLRRGKIEVF